MDSKQYDLIVIGGGPAGCGAAIRGAQLGAGSVLMIEKESLGGTCLNRGCIPTKFLWESLNLLKRSKRSADYGITLESKEINLASIVAQKNRKIDLLTKGLTKLIESYSIETARGIARFISPKDIEVTSQDSEKQIVTGKKIIIATGSVPGTLPDVEIDHKKVIDSTDALNLHEAPKSLLVIGGGAIGIELATIMCGFGSNVTLIEKENQLLPGEDSELAQEAKKILQRQGTNVQTGVASADEYIKGSNKALVAVGRKPNMDLLDLDKAGIKRSKHGIEVNAHMETSQQGIYAAGDVTGHSYFAYIAQAESIIAVENAFGKSITSALPPIPRVVFSYPTIAGVGAGEDHRSPNTINIGRFPMSANSKAHILNERTGWVKIVAHKDTGRILAGYIISPDAENLITIIALAIKHKLTVKDLERETFFHPSLAEAIHGACEDFSNTCIDLPRPENRH